MYTYKVYDADDNLVFQGSTRDVCYEFNIALCSLYSYYGRKSKIGGIYRVERVQLDEETKQPIKKPSKYEKTLDYLIRHLDRYGNVYLNENPEKYLKELEKNGYKVKVDTYITVDHGNIVINEKVFNGRKNKRYKDYVLTRLV